MKTRTRQMALWQTFAIAALCAFVIAGTAMAQRPASIPFADIGNLRDWRADGNTAIYIQSNNRQWYRATFWSPCVALPFVERVAFVTESSGELDRFSSILVDGERCWFRTFERADAPPRRARE